MEDVKVIRIFLGAPSDVTDEKKAILNFKNELDQIIGKPNNLRFDITTFEEGIYPGAGEEPQGVINEQVKEKYEIFLGIFWLRVGTPTKNYPSGTIEEFEKAYEKWKKHKEGNHILLYFKTASPENVFDIDTNQLNKLKEFKNSLSERGIVYQEFENIDRLIGLLRLHLSKVIQDKFLHRVKDLKEEQVDSDTEIDNNEEVERDIAETELGLFEYVEEFQENIQRLPIVTDRITSAMDFITKRVREKTNQIQSISNITDDRLRLKKVKILTDQVAENMFEFVDKVNEDLPEFKEALNSTIDSYGNIYLMASTYSESGMKEAKDELDRPLPELHDAIENAISGISEFLESIKNLPPFTKKFIKAKNESEQCLKEMLSEFVKAQVVLDELI